MPSSLSRHRPARFGVRGTGGAALLAACVLLTACGGDGGGGSTTGASVPATTTAATPAPTTTAATLTHAQLVEQADAACASAAEAIAAVPPARSLSALADYAQRVGQIGTDLSDALGALRPAAADRAAFQTYVDGVDASNQALAAMGSAATSGDAGGVRSAARSIDEVGVGVLATRAGLPGCAATSASGAGS